MVVHDQQKTILMRIFVKVSRSLVPETITLSSVNSNRKRNIGKYFWIYSFLTHLPPAVENSANLMPVSAYLFQIKVSGKNTKTTLASYFTKLIARTNFTLLRVIKQIEFIEY